MLEGAKKKHAGQWQGGRLEQRHAEPPFDELYVRISPDTFIIFPCKKEVNVVSFYYR